MRITLTALVISLAVVTARAQDESPIAGQSRQQYDGNAAAAQARRAQDEGNASTTSGGSGRNAFGEMMDGIRADRRRMKSKKQSKQNNADRLADIEKNTYSEDDRYRLLPDGNALDVSTGEVVDLSYLKKTKKQKQWIADQNQSARFQASLRRFNEKYPQ